MITKDPHQWVVVTNEQTGEKLEVMNDETKGHNFRFTFTVNFSDSPTPSVNQVSFNNMSKKHRNFFAKKEKLQLYFNWGKTKKLLCEGYITKIDHNQTDGVTETFVVTFTEGTNYNNIDARKMKVGKKVKYNKYHTIKVKKKGKIKTKITHYYTEETYKSGKKKGQKHKVRHIRRHKVKEPDKWVKKRVKTRATKTKYVNKTYPKGKNYKQLIEGVASQGGIKISKIDLVKNPIMKKAWTATGKPLTLIENLVKKTGSKITYVQGKFEIVNPKSAKRSWIDIDDEDLLTPPSYNEADDGTNGTWEITTPLLVDAKINDGVLMKSKYLKGRFYIKAGVHSNDGENPQTQCSLAPM